MNTLSTLKAEYNLHRTIAFEAPTTNRELMRHLTLANDILQQIRELEEISEDF